MRDKIILFIGMLLGACLGFLAGGTVSVGYPYNGINTGIYSCEYARTNGNMVIFLAKKEPAGSTAAYYSAKKEDMRDNAIAACNHRHTIAVVDGKITAYRP